ncbi:MAG: hypothetical protein M1823_008101, partial [Watsoniomyces obsoletus]
MPRPQPQSPQGRPVIGQSLEDPRRRPAALAETYREGNVADLATLLAGIAEIKSLVPKHQVIAAMTHEAAYAEGSLGVRELVAQMLPNDPLAKNVRLALSMPLRQGTVPRGDREGQAKADREKHFRERWHEGQDGLLYHQDKLYIPLASGA